MRDHSISPGMGPLWVSMVNKLYAQSCLARYMFLLVALSAGFFCLAWCSCWFGYLLFVAIVPILLIIKLFDIKSRQQSQSFIYCFFYIFLTLLLWNTLTIWWIYNAAFEAFLFVAFYNAFCLSLPCCAYYYMCKWGGSYVGYIGLVLCWIILEYAHLTWEYWELAFPWLNLGNGVIGMAQWIQWYEYTGILGGSLWILGGNILIYHMLFEKKSWLLFQMIGAWFVLPILTSLVIYCNHVERGVPVEAVVVQPNFNSYTEKDSTSPYFVPYAHQIDRLLALSKGQVTSSTCLVVWPESAISCWMDESCVHNYVLMHPILKFLEQHSTLNLITGVTSFCTYGGDKVTSTARFKGGKYVDLFNSIFHLKAGNQIDIYHKEKRLPGAEYIPYFHVLPDSILHWLRKKFAEIGDINPCLGKGDGAKVFAVDDQVKIAPINCYESLYGAFVGDASQKGATLFAVVANDGWWGDTSVYQQHFQYSRLLAIAHRKSVIRSANTGITGFINQRGDVIAKVNRLEPVAMRQLVYSNRQITFYSLYGDYIGRMAVWAYLLLCLYLFVMRVRKKWSLIA